MLSGLLNKRLTLLILALTAVLACGGVRVLADDSTGKDLQFSNPLDGATVRETVPVSIPRASLPSDGGYVLITIDDVFRLATALPSDSDIIWNWDTKGSFTPSDSDTPIFTKDGYHTIQVKVYSHANVIWGTANAKVHIANTIARQNLPDGIKLAYKWMQIQAHSDGQKFLRSTSLESNSSGSGLPDQSLQTSKIEFLRTADDDGDDTYRVVDKVLPGGVVYDNTSGVYVESAYQLKAKARSVNGYGLTIRNELPISSGSHFAFDIPQFSPRRVQVGDAWEASIPVMLQWAVEKPTYVRGSARLDTFEWEDHFPTAKIVETYDGPATINIDATDPVSPATNVNVKLTRIVWFAYSLGRVVRESLDMKVSGPFSSSQVGALGVSGMSDSKSGGSGAPQNGGQQANPFAPATQRNSVGGFNATPGASTNTGQATSDMVFHVTEDMVAELK